MNDSTYQFFTEDDFKKILTTQGDIKTDVAVATNDLKWIIDNYKNQCKEIEDLKTTVENLKTDFWKYIGIGIGISITVSLFISLFPIIRALLAGT
jgi:uncharacterized membrane protein YukC